MNDLKNRFKEVRETLKEVAKKEVTREEFKQAKEEIKELSEDSIKFMKEQIKDLNKSSLKGKDDIIKHVEDGLTVDEIVSKVLEKVKYEDVKNLGKDIVVL